MIHCNNLLHWDGLVGPKVLDTTILGKKTFSLLIKHSHLLMPYTTLELKKMHTGRRGELENSTITFLSTTSQVSWKLQQLSFWDVSWKLQCLLIWKKIEFSIYPLSSLQRFKKRIPKIISSLVSGTWPKSFKRLLWQWLWYGRFPYFVIISW